MKVINKLRQSMAKRFYRNPLIARIVANQYHRSFYYRKEKTWQDTHWFGAPLLKCPLDLWVYQELLYSIKPDFVIECGTNRGGSAYFMANIMDLIGHGRIITIDIEDVKADNPTHERVDYLIGSSTSKEIADQVKSIISDAGGDGPVMAILDSDHSRDHVVGEMNAFHEMVTPGSYLIVEDTNLNGHPVNPAHGPGPMEAVFDFLKTNDSYEIDHTQTKYLMTCNPNGYLKRLR